MLETTRLIIRNFAEADAEDLYAYLSLSDTYRFEPGAPISFEDAQALAKERADGAFFSAVVLKASATMIG